MTISFKGNTVTVDGHSIQLEWPVRDAVEADDKVFILLDPNSYLIDATYKTMRRTGAPAIRNLMALQKDGTKLWDAELPEADDYFYRISSIAPLIVNSFSSFRCVIDTADGTIASKEFLK